MPTHPDPTVNPSALSAHTQPTNADPPLLQNATKRYNSSENTEGHLPETPIPDPTLPARQFLHDQTQPLTPQQLAAIDLLLTGRSDARAAAAVNCHRVTVTRWRLYNHVFQAELNRRRQEVYGAAADKLRATLSKAVHVFQKQIRNADQNIAYRAAKALLQLAGSSNFARPADPTHAPTDPLGVLDLEARRVHVELSSIDPTTNPLYDEDRALALRSLRHRSALNPAPLDNDSPQLETATTELHRAPAARNPA